MADFLMIFYFILWNCLFISSLKSAAFWQPGANLQFSPWILVSNKFSLPHTLYWNKVNLKLTNFTIYRQCSFWFNGFGQNYKNIWHNKEMVYTRMLHVRHFGVMDLMHSHNLLTLNIFLIKFSIEESINRLEN